MSAIAADRTRALDFLFLVTATTTTAAHRFDAFASGAVFLEPRAQRRQHV